MKKHNRNLNFFSSDNDWTLFLDRDGVINQRIVGDYVKSPEEFQFIDGVPEAISILNGLFRYVIVVTNQQGVGKGKMTGNDVEAVHHFMENRIKQAGGILHRVYFCPRLEAENPACRKPRPGMALQAQKEFAGIKFKKSIMVGDTRNDMLFGKRLGMLTVLIASTAEARKYPELIDFRFDSLPEFAAHLQKVNTHNADN